MTTPSLRPARHRRPSFALLAVVALAAGGIFPLHEAVASSPAPPSVIVPLDPVRILDTRLAIGIPTTTPVAPGQTVTLQVTGVAGIPPEATGVVLNVTITRADGSGWATAWPSSEARPTASVINYQAGADVANMITASLGADGAIDLYNAQANAHLVADVAGYLLPAGNGGTPGPPGPTGPQGPPGPAGPAAQKVTFRRSFTRPAPGQPEAQVAVGSIASVNVFASCRSDAAEVTLRPASPADGLSLRGSKVNALPEEVDVLWAESAVAIGARPTPGSGHDQQESHVSAIVITAGGTYLDVDLWLDLNDDNCELMGTILRL